VELRDLESYSEPGAIVYRVDCMELIRLVPAGSVDAIFADPPYRLSTGGVTVKSGRLAPVDKGDWDKCMGGRSSFLTDGQEGHRHAAQPFLS
jgi:site-specific DNA-methyltransferase (adenine-specific)